MIQKINFGHLSGEITLPPSKSDAQRAILAAALTNGLSRIKYPGKSADVLAMIETIKTMGADVRLENGDLLIKGAEILPVTGVFNVGESGLGLRILLALLSIIGGEFTVNAKGSLLNRDQQFIVDFLNENGVEVQSNNYKPPFQLKGQLKGHTFKIDGSHSSQFVSGLLMGFPLLENRKTVLHVDDLKSIPYVNMTLDTLRKFGIEVNYSDYNKFEIPGNQKFEVTDYLVEADWSAASYWMVASALGHDVIVRGLNTNSFQADRALIKALYDSGCAIDLGEDIIKVHGENRVPLDFDATHCPDLIPSLAIYAAFTNGVSRIQGVSRLSNKESDRGIVIKNELQKMGVLVQIEGDDILIHGGRKVHSASIDSHSDHRIAMSFAIAGTFAKEGIEINGAEAVDKSYPDFWKDYNSLS